MNPEVLEIPEFKVLWDRDKSKTKDTVFKEFKYIYYTEDVSSPFADYPQSQKEGLIINDVFGKAKFKVDEAITLAANKFRLLSETPTQALLKAVKGKISDLSAYLKTTAVNEDSVSSILKVIESTSKLVGQLSILQDSVNKETEEAKQKVRGSKKIGMFEDN